MEMQRMSYPGGERTRLIVPTAVIIMKETNQIQSKRKSMKMNMMTLTMKIK
jgi:hypothetical protein